MPDKTLRIRDKNHRNDRKEYVKMAYTQEQYDELVMGIIVEGGNARSLAMEAIQEAKGGNVSRAEELLKECGDALTEAHRVQTDLIQSEIQGEHIQVMLLMVHAQDHLMDAMVIRDLAAEFVELYKRING